MFTADAGREPFEDVSLKTLRSEFVEQAVQLAHAHGKKSLKSAEKEALKMIASGAALPVQEYVEVSSDGIVVCIHTAQITDEIIWEGLVMLMEALDKLNGQYGKITFGQPMTFFATEIPWLHRH